MCVMWCRWVWRRVWRYCMLATRVLMVATSFSEFSCHLCWNSELSLMLQGLQISQQCSRAPFLSVLLSLFDQILHFLHEALVFLVCSSKVTVGFSISLRSIEWVDWCYVDFLEHMVFTWRTLSFHLTVAFLITCLQWEVSWRNWQVCHRSLHFACAFSAMSVNQGGRVMLAFLWQKSQWDFSESCGWIFAKFGQLLCFETVRQVWLVCR